MREVDLKKFVRVLCHTCEGEGEMEETSYPDLHPVKIVCPECQGDKFVTFKRSEVIEDES